MKCKLCLEEKELIKESHLIPDFMYKSIKGIDNSMMSIDGNQIEKARRVHTGEFENNILCKDCDNAIIGNYESYASKIINYQTKIKGISATKFIDENNNLKHAEIKGLDYSKFKLFLLSLLWRASISNREFFKNVKLGLEEEESLRKMLLNSNPGEPDDFPCIVCLPNQSLLLNKFIQSPIVITKENRKIGYSFLIGGTYYYFYIVKNALPFPIEKFAINKNGELTILFLSKEKTGTIEQKYTNFFIGNKIN